MKHAKPDSVSWPSFASGFTAGLIFVCMASWDYPQRLRDATHPVELLYFQGWWDLIDTPSVAVVGTRKPSEDGKRRTRRLVKALLADKFTIVSGLAEGIDTVAQETAIGEGGQTIGVIGTPLGHIYPKSNEKLQKTIAEKFLLISQIPVERYEAQNPKTNRFFFPERKQDHVRADPCDNHH